MSLSRRNFLRDMAIAAGAFSTGATGAEKGQTLPLPAPSSSGIEHVIVVTMENRSFDHYLGWLKDADGRQEGLVYFDKSNLPQSTYHLTDYQGCGHPDPDHTYQGGRVEYNNGACDGWLRAGTNDAFAIGYYTRKDLPFLAEAALRWTALDRYFAAIMAETIPNRIYQHSAQTDRIDGSLGISVLPTIWDRLAAAGLSGRYYFSDVPFLALWGAKYVPIGRPFAAFLLDCALGTLPHVAFVEPRVLGEGLGISGDDHPHADIRNGEVFLNRVYEAVTNSPAWSKTVLVINYDEWGGFFDHVPPPPVAPEPFLPDGLRGFRVPSLIISPWSSRLLKF